MVDYASPLKLFEYLALGKAIVAPGQPNIREILTHEKNALLFDPAHPEQLAASIHRLCIDTALRLHVAQGARDAIVEQQLTWKANARRVVELFSSLEKRHA